MATMKALYIEGPGRVEIREIPKPEPGPDEVMLRVGVVGFCGSDRKTYLGLNNMVVGPRIPGHEIGATIEKVGSVVPGHLRPGLQCTISPYTACDECNACRQGRTNTCANNKTHGVQRDGAMCEYIIVPWEKIFISSRLSLRELALVEPLTVGFHAANRGDVEDSDNVLVLGVGAVGLGAIAGANHRGAKVTALIRSQDKDDIAKAMGANKIVRPKDLPSLNQAFDVVIEATGSSDMISAALDAVDFAGRAVYVGYSSGDVIIGNMNKLTQKELNVYGSRNAKAEDFNDVIRALEAGRLPVERLISKEVSLAEAGAALQAWSDGEPAIRILVSI